VKALLTALTLFTIGLVTCGIIALIRTYPAVGIPLSVALLVGGLIRSYNALLVRAEETYRRRKR
jgi:hypothetical protein